MSNPPSFNYKLSKALSFVCGTIGSEAANFPVEDRCFGQRGPLRFTAPPGEVRSRATSPASGDAESE